MRFLALLLALALPFSVLASNLDFSLGTLHGWQGSGFYLTSASARGPSLRLGVCSSDGGRRACRGGLRFTFQVPQRAHLLRCTAYAARPNGTPADDRLDVLLLHGPAVLPRLVKRGPGWAPAPDLLPRLDGEPQEYAWDISGHSGKVLEVLLLDDDPRPGCYLFCSGFQVHARANAYRDQFASDIRLLTQRHQLVPLTRYESTHFVAWSNADDGFTVDRLRNCDLFYRFFFEHFRMRGFTLQRPTEKLMVAIFDGQRGFEAYVGRTMSASITGVYERRSNRLVLYDVNSNDAILASKQQALALSKKILRAGDRIRFVEAVQRQARDLSLDASVATAIHETAHHLSFNTGLLNRVGDVPLWLAEGLACYCEATDQGSWQGLGEVNPLRLSTLAATLERNRPLLPLQTLLSDDDWRSSSKSIGTAYAQGWALFRQLMQERPGDLRRYLTRIYPRRTPTHRLADFQEIFGTDLVQLEASHRRYITRLVAQHGGRK